MITFPIGHVLECGDRVVTDWSGKCRTFIWSRERVLGRSVCLYGFRDCYSPSLKPSHSFSSDLYFSASSETICADTA